MEISGQSGVQEIAAPLLLPTRKRRPLQSEGKSHRTRVLSYSFTTGMARSVKETRMAMIQIRREAKKEVSMQFEGAVIREQGVTFAIVIVQPHVLDTEMSCDRFRSSFRGAFPGMPMILMAQDHYGTPTYQGRRDIVSFLTNVHPSRIPWKRYNYS